MTSVTASRTVASSRTRLHGLDALRAGALLLGIVLHSLLPFLPGIPWLVTDSQTSMVLGIPVYVIHLFRMVLFMLLAGFFGRLVVHRRGPRAYARDRTIRILLPLIAFWPVSVMSLGVLAVVNANVNRVPLPPAPPADDLWLAITPGQLWFLWVLMQCVAIVLVLRALAGRVLGPQRRARASRWLGRLLATPAGVLLAAVPYAIGLLLQGTVQGGIIAPPTLLPSAPALTAYLGAFVVGWTLQAHQDALRSFARYWPAQLVAAVVLSGYGLTQSGPEATAGLPVLATVTALAGWCWTYALLGICVRFLDTPRGWIRYLADASYWMYLVHLPLLVGFEILLVGLGWPIAVKLGLTWLVVGVVLLVSYQLLVRRTVLGLWLNGRRHASPARTKGPHLER